MESEKILKRKKIVWLCTCVYTLMLAHLLTFSLELAIMFTHLHLLPISLNMGTGEVSVNINWINLKNKLI